VVDGFDIFAGQPTPEDLLAELYDLEHDGVDEDLPFYRELARRTRGAALDLGCGSGRLFRALLSGGIPRIVGVDGSAALLRRAEQRIAADPELRSAAAAGRIELVRGDIRRLRRRDHFGLIVAVGVLPHLDGPPAVLAMLRGARHRLTRAGRLVLDDLGPAEMPARDLPLSTDWSRVAGGRRVTRLSRLLRSEEAGGIRVAFSTLTESEQADGTIARLPAGYRLWYPSPVTLESLAEEAGLAVELRYGSHDLDALDQDSERRIFVTRRAAWSLGGAGGRQDVRDER
jgi:SAM-dependent methyltransferase